jgi:hypothetical protein
MKTTKELHVLNKHKAFGYVLEQPLALVTRWVKNQMTELK